MIKDIKTYLRTVGLRGLFSAAKARALGTNVLFKVNRHDIMFPFNLRVPTSDVATYEQIFINQECKFLVEAPPKVIIDAGANIGLASIYFANKYPSAQIIAIEPEESNFALLRNNVAPYSTIVPIQAALWNKVGEISLVDPGLGKWGFMTQEQNTSEAKFGVTCHKVTAITIEKVIHDFKLDKIDILKIDIEGAEKEVFTDTSPWIEKVDTLIIELHEDMKNGCNRSFYNGSNNFDNEWKQGENLYLSRRGLTKRCV
jgi:FkbM family methyltransferase